jgi:hypothetical protein
VEDRLIRPGEAWKARGRSPVSCTADGNTNLISRPMCTRGDPGASSYSVSPPGIRMRWYLLSLGKIRREPFGEQRSGCRVLRAPADSACAHEALRRPLLHWAASSRAGAPRHSGPTDPAGRAFAGCEFVRRKRGTGLWHGDPLRAGASGPKAAGKGQWRHTCLGCAPSAGGESGGFGRGKSPAGQHSGEVLQNGAG